MKSKLFLLSFLMLLTVATNYAQTSASVAGIAVQGIARDNNNTARNDETLSLSFRIYYLPNATIYEVSKTVKTDAFGVFSVVLEPGAANNVTIANNQAYLKISEGTTIISDEMLRQVPYAIAASYAITAKNEVPTGSIMPYIGANAPEGWVLCDGGALPSSATALIGMVGSNAPDLKGMFLRGAGENLSYAGEIDQHGLKTFQFSDNKEHLHGVTDPGHNHDYDDAYFSETDGPWLKGLLYGSGDSDAGNGGYQFTRTSQSRTTGITINKNGGSESRPINYAVNYIIKL
jgi:hypothetical protein